jgi:hypothetical protein
MRSSPPSFFAKITLIFCFAILAISSAFAAVNGALQTTTASGTVVNGNIYTDKANVYISGGPQNHQAAGLSPAPGLYYFQVTDPSGAVLLSLDDIRCRVVFVNSDGRVDGVPSDDGTAEGSPGAGTPGCYHNSGTPDVSDSGLSVQLCSAAGCPSGPPPGNSPLSYYDTPNPGGEYKAWITPVANYSNCTQTTSHVSFGFCDSDSKTDNFKVKPPNVATITACKFIDLDGNSTYDPGAGDFLTSGWQITATGVDGGTGSGVTQTTDQDGCTTWTFTFPKGVATDTVTLTEIQQNGFNQVAPTPVSGGPTACTLTGTNVNAADTCSVSGGVITATISPNDIAVAPFFGNAVGANLVGLAINKTATGGNMFNWNISKSAGTLQQDSTNGTATFSYTVTVSHDAGTGWVVGGNISVTNPNTTGGGDGNGSIDGATITDTLDAVSAAAPFNGTCNVNGTGTNSYGPVTILGGTMLTIPYTCTFSQNPGTGTNFATVIWTGEGGGQNSVPQPFDFTSADTSVTVTDTLAGNLGTVSVNADNSTACATAASGFATNGSGLACAVSGATTTFTYSLQFTGDPAGTCTQHNNTASFATNTNPNTPVNSNQVTVTQCVGEDLTVSKTANANFTANLSKSVDKTKVEQSGGNITFNYTVSLTSPAFSVAGTITVSNPNNWESITANIADTIDSGGTCTVYSDMALTKPITSVTVAASGSVTVFYNCAYTTNPTRVSGTNTASVSSEAATDTGASDPNKGGPGIVPGTPTPGTHAYTFSALTVTDNVQVTTVNPSGCNATLGTVTAVTTGTTVSTTPGCGITGLTSPSWGVFKYSITDANASPGTCASFTDTASDGGSSSNPVTVTVCNTNTGALTMGFWKNTNGQKIINGSGPKTGTCTITPWLRQFNPFADMSASATCSQVASYVNTVLSAATCGGSTCNPMLKAQMLATALDVYFSTPGLGGNQIGAFNGLGSKTPPLGAVAIDLSHVCAMVDGSSSSSCSGSFEDARPVFGIANTCQGATVNTMLAYSDFGSSVNGSPVSNVGGKLWYTIPSPNYKPKQVVAKDAFDSTNNTVANIATGTVCSSTL